MSDRSVSPRTTGASEGIAFPAGESGQRSTVAFGREVLATAVGAVAPAEAAAIRAERRWRENYPAHVRRLVECSLRSDTAAIDIARAGLAAIAAQMRFVRDGAEPSIAAAMAAPRPGLLRSIRLDGRGHAAPAPLSVPYEGRELAGDALLRQLDHWLARDIVEPSFAEAMRRVHDHPEWLDLADQHIVVLGAGAELGPLTWLARRRANLIAVDLPRPAIWQRLIATGRAGNGTLQLPVRAAQDPASDDELARHAGADLLIETPEVADWLGRLSVPLTVGAYAYLDGAQHVRVAVAMDAIQAHLAKRSDTTLALLTTPTDVYAVPGDVLRAAHARHAGRPVSARAWQQPLRCLAAGRLFERNVMPAAGRDFGIVDALVVQQGPNYALAKRLQQWRALVARAEQRRVSVHIAPPSLTGSVLKNRLMAAAYRAAAMFGVEAFAPETASALMAALLVHDLRHERAAAHPQTPLPHPLLLLADAAHHGGLWRMPFAARSALPVAAAIGALRRR